MSPARWARSRRILRRMTALRGKQDRTPDGYEETRRDARLLAERKDSTRRAAVERYAAARRALCMKNIRDYAAGIDYETPEFLRLNSDIAVAERWVSWWRRALIDRRILRELDYWNRMSGGPS